MSRKPIDIWANNDREFVLEDVKKRLPDGSDVTVNGLGVTVYLTVLGAPDASPISGTTVSASNTGDGEYTARFDGLANLPLSVMRAAAGGPKAKMWLHWVSGGNLHIQQPLAYSENRLAK